jgi:hypothetical protein
MAQNSCSLARLLIYEVVICYVSVLRLEKAQYRSAEREHVHGKGIDQVLNALRKTGNASSMLSRPPPCQPRKVSSISDLHSF